MQNSKNFDVKKYKKLYDESDVVLIEISSIVKICGGNNFLYQKVNTSKYDRNLYLHWVHDLKRRSGMDIKEIIQDLKKILLRISKPVIFQGAMNFYFAGMDSLKKYDYRMVYREKIDFCLKEIGGNIIILEDVFKDDKLEEICGNDIYDDISHLSNFALIKLGKHLDDMIKSQIYR